MCMVKPEDELPGMAEHILSLRISGWDPQTGICFPVNALRHTPVPDCVAMLNSLWERNSVKTILPRWTQEVTLRSGDLLCSAAMTEMPQAGIESQG